MPPYTSDLPRLRDALHICIDMQMLFDTGQPWEAQWFRPILPNVLRLVEAASQTLFTRFIPPSADERPEGCWQPYWQKWDHLRRGRIDPKLIELVPELRPKARTGSVFDKSTYSPWQSRNFKTTVRQSGANTLILSGGESDVCVLAAALGAIDRGYFVVLAEDALWGTFDATHDAALRIYRDRLSVQLSVMPTDEIISQLRTG